MPELSLAGTITPHNIILKTQIHRYCVIVLPWWNSVCVCVCMDSLLQWSPVCQKTGTQLSSVIASGEILLSTALREESSLMNSPFGLFSLAACISCFFIFLKFHDHCSWFGTACTSLGELVRSQWFVCLLWNLSNLASFGLAVYSDCIHFLSGIPASCELTGSPFWTGFPSTQCCGWISIDQQPRQKSAFRQRTFSCWSHTSFFFISAISCLVKLWESSSSACIWMFFVGRPRNG